MINQNNPFYGSAGFTPMPGTSYTPQNGNYVTQSQTYQNPYIQQPNRFQSIPGRNTGNCLSGLDPCLRAGQAV